MDRSRARLTQRLLKHHLPLACGCMVVVAVLYSTRPYRDPISRANFATAYPALSLLLVTLIVGPLQALRRKRNPVSGDLRRDLGIWAGVLGIAHSAIGQTVHLRGRPWLYYVYEHRSLHVVPLRHDLFGFANFTGLAGALVLIALLATSNDYSLRALGAPRWKQLQRWNYAAFALASAHTLAYLETEHQPSRLVGGVLLSLSFVLAVQLAGYQHRRTLQSPDRARGQSKP